MTESTLTPPTLTPGAAEALAIARKWIDLYNGDDMKKFVDELYGPDGTVTLFDGAANLGREPSITDHEFFVQHEYSILAATPGRRLRERRIVATEGYATVECDYIDINDPKFLVPICSVLTIKDGYVFSDHSYLNRNDLPGAKNSLKG